MLDPKRWRLFWICLSFMMYPSLAAAATAELHLLAIDINRTATNVVAPVLIVDEAVHLSPAVFEQLRIRLPDVPALGHLGGRYYPLAAHEGTTFEIDEREQALHLTVPPRYMMQTVITRARGRRRVEPSATSFGGFLNYDLLSERNTGVHSLGGLFEVGAFAGDYVVTGTQVARNLDDGAREYIRLDTTLTRDYPDDRRTLRLGDSITRGGLWGRPARFGGIQMGSNFATQPSFVTYPAVGLSGDAALPSSVDVLINDSRRFSDRLPSGPFTIENLPVVTGAGEVTAVVTDVLGRETVISEPYYLSPTLLRDNLHDFSFETGLLRESFGTESNNYADSPFFTGTYRYGYNDGLTGEIHAEGEDHRQALGIGATFPVWHHGVVSSAVAGSLGDDEGGALFQLGFERVGRDFSVAAFGRLTEGEFTDLGAGEEARSSDAEGRLRLGIPFGAWGAVSGAYTYRAFDGETDEQVVSASYTVRIPKVGSLSVTGLKTYGASEEALVSVNLTIPLGPRASTSARAQFAENQKTLKTFEAQAAPPLEGGFGTRMSVSDNDFTRAQIELSHTSRYGVFSAAGSRVDDQHGARLNAVGGVVVAGGDVFLARRILNSFAVVSVPDQPDVRVYSENRLAGRTDSSGRLLLHNLRAYDANTISIEPRDLPIGAEVGQVSATVAPRFRSGVAIEFGVDGVRPVLLALHGEDGRPLPPGARVMQGGSDRSVLVGLEGEVLLRDVVMGERLTVELGPGAGGGRCNAVVDRAIPDEPYPFLGIVICRRGAP